MAWVKFFHLLIGVSFFGGVIASYYYSVIAYNSNQLLKDFSLKNIVKIEVFIFIPAIALMFLTGSLLVYLKKIPLSTPWIIVAYIALFLILIGTIINSFLKKHRMKTGYLHILNIILICLLAIIVHDAVMKHTFLGYFFR